MALAGGKLSFLLECRAVPRHCCLLRLAVWLPADDGDTICPGRQGIGRKTFSGGDTAWQSLFFCQGHRLGGWVVAVVGDAVMDSAEKLAVLESSHVECEELMGAVFLVPYPCFNPVHGYVVFGIIDEVSVLLYYCSSPFF